MRQVQTPLMTRKEGCQQPQQTTQRCCSFGGGRRRRVLLFLVIGLVLYDLSQPLDIESLLPPTHTYTYESNQFPIVSVGNWSQETAAAAREKSSTFPRIIQVHFEKKELNKIPSTLKMNRTVILPFFNYGFFLGEEPWRPTEDQRSECVPMDWQENRFLSCNNMHEAYLQDLRFINCGGSRCAFQFNDIDGIRQVVKVKNFDDWFGAHEQETARVDALVMERLTKSPYVSSIFAACGTSQFVEYSAHGNLFDWMKLTRHKQRPLPTPVEKLKLAIQISSGVADIHAIDENKGFVSMAHNDVCCHQFMMVDGVFKIGDFHLSSFMRLNVTSGKACTEEKAYINPAINKVRAPEELTEESSPIPRDKVDVYLMGNIMYYVLTQRWIFEKVPSKKAQELLIAGNRSDIGFIPTHPAEQAVEKAIRWCWAQDPHTRPTAREISNMLRDVLKELEGVPAEEVVRVSVPPLPKNYDFSDKEFYANLGQDLQGKPV